jgi:predicted transcriptional regulator
MAKRNKPTREPALPALHELEAEVMEELWSRGEAPVRAVMDALNKRASKERAYTTYMTIMARLHKKGVLDRRREGKTDFYAPRLDRDEFMAARARAEVESLRPAGREPRSRAPSRASTAGPQVLKAPAPLVRPSRTSPRPVITVRAPL